VLAGPFCCHQLAHMGAEVIKVEAAGRGDLARQLGADPDLNARGMGVSFLRRTRARIGHGEPQASRGQARCSQRLVETADVVVENFRPGVMERLGVGYEVLKGVRPTCLLRHLGLRAGRAMGERPAYDQIIQGASGVMSITGDATARRLRVGYPIADTVGGMTAAFAIAAALNARPRGAHLDVSMLESVLATMGWVVSPTT
jgi:crotonobetainyl-CoA:carnitine CoA-transferase CaiB-like acyl-CoA transferase